MNRLKEGSTWAGFAAVLAALASSLPAYADLFTALAGVAAAIAARIPDAGAPK